MKIDEVSHLKLKEYINLVYMQGENKNEEAILKLEEKIKSYIKNVYFIISIEDNEIVKIPYGNNEEFVCPIFTDKREYTLGMQYFSLNDMDENKEYIIEKLDKFNEKLISNPNFLGYLVNISSISYIINTSLI